MTPHKQRQVSNNRGFALAVSVFLAACSAATTAAAAPTCQSQPSDWYFPNSCNTSCKDLGSSMDTDRTRNVNGKKRCFCVGIEKPFCTDDPACEDLGIFPGTAQEDCASVCGESSVDVTATTIVNDNGYQFHFVVSCSCKDGTKKCGDDFVLFSDLDYMKSCSGGDSNSLKIASNDQCDSFCLDTLIFEGGTFVTAGQNKTCSCVHSDIQSDDKSKDINQALACDDATARANDGSGLGNPCYSEVGVNVIECPESAAPPSGKSQTTSATKTMVSSGAIVGVWLLPW